MSEVELSASDERVQQLADLPLEGPVVMLNLLKFKSDGGREEYTRYGQLAGPFLQKSGASVRYLADVVAPLIGGEEWDEAILVEYPSRQAFIDMVTDPDYPRDVRAGALVDSRLYCMQTRLFETDQ